MVSKHKAGLALGLILGLWHLTWSLLVAIGVAQVFLDWIFRLHFIQPPYTIAPFRFGLAVALIAVTTCSTSHPVMRLISSSESFSPGMSKQVTSVQTFVSLCRYKSVSSTGWRWAEQILW